MMKGKQMIYRENWTLVTQDVLNSKEELTIPYGADDMKNITIGI